MTMHRKSRVGLAALLVIVLIGGIALVTKTVDGGPTTRVTAYFPNTNGMFVGDEVRILGVAVGKILTIEPQPQQVKVAFEYDSKYDVPATANAVILAPSLVTSRAIQLTPAYTDGPKMTDNAVIPIDRTVVPVEYDDFRRQLQTLSDSLQPTRPGGVSTLGAYVNTAAENLRGEGTNIREAILQASATLSALGDHSADLFGTIRNLSVLVSALQDSTGVMKHLNTSLAGVTALLSNNPGEVARAVDAINDVVDDVKSYVAENREALGVTSDKLASLTTALAQSKEDIKQALHIAPTTFQNFVNMYQPAQAALTGAIAAGNFSNPITFLCGAIQAASRLNAEQAAKLCVQYLAPIVKNRQYNILPVGLNPFVGATARPNEIDYSEDWLRPDYVPAPGPAGPAAPPVAAPPLAAEAAQDVTPAAAQAGALEDAPGARPTDAADPPRAPVQTDPQAGLSGLMVPTGTGQ